ncbi:MAG: HAMP domain-containing sensor histidine kinase [Candidatus Metalachnospira sp.]|nr:HAMP domain-containing sensor histidine kinase [Candidatus Metalachnospira sp.]
MKSIRTKLWSGMMLMMAIIMVLLWLFQIVFLDKFYTVFEVGDVKKNAESIVQDIGKLKTLSQINDSDQITQEMENFVYEKQLTAEIIDTNYNVVYQKTSGSSMMMPGMMGDTFTNIVLSALNGEELTQKVIHQKFGYEFMIIGKPILIENSVKGAMIITMPMASIEKTTGILTRQLIIITAVLLIVSVLISLKLSQNFANPILKISRQAESYASGKYKVRITDAGDDEIGRLAERMNDMGEALARNDILQKELIANVSHELRTPLTLIRGYAETLRDITGDNTQKREKQLSIIIDESERLGKIVEDILKLSQLQAGAVTLEMGSFSLSDMLMSIKENYELDMKGRTLDLINVCDLKENLLGDQNRLQQVFYNLIGNAFRHSNENMPVEVSVKQESAKVKIEVRDYGEGIKEEDLPHVFERYYKGTRADGKKSEGTGLGLAIVKSILEMHHANYGVESRLGEGTVFWFELDKEKSHTSF